MWEGEGAEVKRREGDEKKLSEGRVGKGSNVKISGEGKRRKLRLCEGTKDKGREGREGKTGRGILR